MKSAVISLNTTCAHSLVNLGKKQRAVSENVNFVLCRGFSQSQMVILSCKKERILFCKAESYSELFITMLKSVTYCVFVKISYQRAIHDFIFWSLSMAAWYALFEQGILCSDPTL